MARYRITCIGHCQSTTGHSHVVSIGIGKDKTSVGVKWTIGAVRDALDAGHQFFALGDSGAEADVAPFDCPCGAATITFVADGGGVEQDDHPPLPVCTWAR